MKSVVEHLFNLIRIPSVSRLSNRPIINYARSALEPAGWQFREFIYRDASDIEKVNLIAAPPEADIDETTIDLALVCHTDTVPFAANWTRATDPFLQNGHVYGCGACDVKGFLACILTAALTPSSQSINHNLRIILTADEEVGCIGISRLMQASLVRPRQVVVGEPTSLQPARAGKGYCLAEVTVFGKEAHSAHPQQGASAIYAASELITAIHTIAREVEAITDAFFNPGYTTVNIGTISGGTAKNIIPGRCTFQLEWRPLPNQPQDAVIQQIRAAALQLEKQWNGAIRYEINVLRMQPGFETPANSGLVHKLEAMSGRPSISIPFGSEAPYFAPVSEEVVVFGPGDMRTAHSERECVPVSELHAAVASLQQLMLT